MTEPASHWIFFLSIVSALLLLDLGVFHPKAAKVNLRDSIRTTIFYVAVACAFGIGIYYYKSPVHGSEYFTGFLIEKALALDNIFVISLVFSYFNIELKLQHRVLFWGILGVIILRGIMIYMGAALINSFSWTLYIFGAFLIITGIKLLFTKAHKIEIKDNIVLKFLQSKFNITEDVSSEKFFVKKKGVWYITKLFLALCIIEFMDIIFAIDSIPAIFAITDDLYIVYTSNIFAILGLRALYFALADMVERFHYLKHALSIILVFIGAKIFVLHIWEIPIFVTLFLTIGIIGAGVAASLLLPKPKLRN